MNRLLLAVLSASTVAASAMAGTVAGVDLGAIASQSRAPAEASRRVFAELVTDRNAARFGLPAAGAVRDARVGVPFADFVVDLPRLAAFRSGVPTESLLRPTDMVVYPLQTAGNGLSSVTMARRGGGWQAVSFGSPARIRAIVTARDEIVRRYGLRPEDFVQVRIAPWNLFFVGHVQGGELQLTSGVSVPKLKIAGGRTMPAAVVFSTLSEFAASDPGGDR